MNKQKPTCIACGPRSFERNTFFNGKLLVERDFEAEQAYFVGKDRMHNSLLHGTGTVCGLKVLAHPNPECRNELVYITPGTAVDCCGRDIVVTENTLIPILDLIEEQEVEVDADGSKDLFISLCYEESLTEKIPVILPDCDCDDANEAYNRILEGFRVHVFSQDAGTREAARPPLLAKLDWKHTLPLPYQSPRALAVDESFQQLYVAAQALPEPTDLPGVELTALLYAYRTDNNDLITAVEGGREPTDLAVSLLGDRIFLATQYAEPPVGDDEPPSPVPIVAFYKEADIRSDVHPAKTIPLEGPARLVVSPHTGALLVLVLDDGDGHAILRSWTNESIGTTWLDSDDATPAPVPSNELLFPSPLTNLDGAAMLNVTLNGRYLFIVDADGGVVRVVDVAAFSDITPAIVSEGDPMAVFTSRDSEYLYVLWHKTVPVDGDNVAYARLTRYAIVSSEGSFDLVLDGSGGEWPSMPVDLAVSPDERWAYVLETVDDQGWVQTVSIDQIASPAEPGLEDLLGTREKISGQASYQQLAVLNGQLYVAAEDEATEAQPERGLIAVLDVNEAACDALFIKTLDGCPTCTEENGGAGHCVILAHIPAYRLGAAIHDPGQAGEDENEIDNLTHRPMLPSTQNITEVIRCMLEQGIAEGIPGPRGAAGPRGPGFQEVVLADPQPAPGSDPTVVLEAIPGDEEGDLRLVLGIPSGADGERGPGITAVAVQTLEPGSDATAILIPIPGDPEGDFVLRLGIPAGGDGHDGARGPGIVDVEVDTLPSGSAATASLVPIPGDPEGDQVLHLGIPRGAPGPLNDPNVIHITNLSWIHNMDFDNAGDLINFLVDDIPPNDDTERQEHLGLVIEFDNPVRMETIFEDLAPDKPHMNTVSRVFELLVRTFNQDVGLALERIMLRTHFHPVEVMERDSQGVITRVQPLLGAETAPAIRLFFWEQTAPGIFDSNRLDFRIVFRADFAVADDGRPVDGNFIGAKLPTGNGRAGNTFESWLTLGERG